MTSGEIHIETFVERTFGENAYVVHTMDADERPVGWVIDPSFPPQTTEILAFLADRGITLEKIVLTHGHADHIAGLDVVAAAHPGAEVAIAAGDQPMLDNPNLNLSAPFGMGFSCETPASLILEPGMTLALGRSTWQVSDTSGHSPGGVSLYCEAANAVITGDALFAGSIGRTDFPGSDHGALIANIREHLLSLPDVTEVYSGHGPTTTIGRERKSNPFLSE